MNKVFKGSVDDFVSQLDYSGQDCNAYEVVVAGADRAEVYVDSPNSISIRHELVNEELSTEEAKALIAHLTLAVNIAEQIKEKL